MRFAEADRSGGHLIESYGRDGIAIDGRDYRHGLILTPEQIVEPWGPARPFDLSAEHLNELLAFSPQVVLLGTGETQVFLDPRLCFDLMGQGIGVEVMDTGAACRTYNILMAEGRRVVAGFMCYAD